MKKVILYSIFIAFGLISCDKYEFVPLGAVGEQSFANDIAPILKENCAGCHTKQDPKMGSDDPYSVLIDEGYVVANDTTSVLLTKVESGHGSLSSVEIDQIRLWIKQGAENN